MVHLPRGAAHATWLTEDEIPEVARRARLGQKINGIARVYGHVTPAMRQQVLDTLEARWLGGLAALTAAEQDQLVECFPTYGPRSQGFLAEIQRRPSPVER